MNRREWAPLQEYSTLPCQTVVTLISKPSMLCISAGTSSPTSKVQSKKKRRRVYKRYKTDCLVMRRFSNYKNRQIVDHTRCQHDFHCGETIGGNNFLAVGPLRGGESPITKPRCCGARRALGQDKQRNSCRSAFTASLYHVTDHLKKACATWLGSIM